MLEEVPQEPELGRREMDLALAAKDAVRGQVHAQVVEAQELLGEGGAHPPQHGADARD